MATGMRRPCSGLLAAALISAIAGCQARGAPPRHGVPGGDVDHGRALIASLGCGNCHTVPGVRGARGSVGPPLAAFDRRDYIAGVLPNNLENLSAWIMTPQRILPGVVMPDMRVTAREARDIAAYLYTLR